MQNHVRNTMQFRKVRAIKGCKVMGVLCPSVVKNMKKDRKLKIFHFLNVREKDKSPHTLR